MQLNLLKIIILLIFFIITSQNNVLAARNLAIESTSKNLLVGDEDLTITASASGFTIGETIYIKGAFYLDGNTNYFGYTENGNTWIKNSATAISQRQLKIGEWDNKLNVKTDFTDSGYVGENRYKLKLGYYYLTSGGSLSAINWTTNSVDIDINEPDNTPAPTPTSSLFKNPTPTKTPNVSISNISPTLSLAIIPKSASNSANLSAYPTPILGANDKSNVNKKNIKDNLSKKVLVNSASKKNAALAIIILGSILILTCGILVYLKIRKNRHV